MPAIQTVNQWHLTTLMDSYFNGAWGGLGNMGECSNPFSCETFIRVDVS